VVQLVPAAANCTLPSVLSSRLLAVADLLKGAHLKVISALFSLSPKSGLKEVMYALTICILYALTLSAGKVLAVAGNVLAHNKIILNFRL